MEKHRNLDDHDFEVQFREARLSPDLFSHEAHLRLAWLHLQHYGQEQAIENICQQIIVYVTKLGAENKFNKTLTVAAIKVVDHFMQKSASNNFFDFIEEFPRLKYNFKDLLAFHYQTDIFNSERAKREYIAPDLLPF